MPIAAINRLAATPIWRTPGGAVGLAAGPLFPETLWIERLKPS